MRKPQKTTRERLLDSAEREFSQRGYSGARVDRIARGARLNKQLLYYYFGGKLGTYVAVLTRMSDDLGLAPTPERPRPTTLPDWIEQRVARALPDRWARWRRILMFEALEFDGRLAQEPERERMARDVVTQLEELQKAGEVDPDLDPNAIYLATQALLMFPGMLPHLQKLTGVPGNAEFAAHYRRVVDVMVDSLCGPKRNESADRSRNRDD